jgi:hypothetical protein
LNWIPGVVWFGLKTTILLFVFDLIIYPFSYIFIQPLYLLH